MFPEDRSAFPHGCRKTDGILFSTVWEQAVLNIYSSLFSASQIFLALASHIWVTCTSLLKKIKKKKKRSTHHKACLHEDHRFTENPELEGTLQIQLLSPERNTQNSKMVNPSKVECEFTVANVWTVICCANPCTRSIEQAVCHQGHLATRFSSCPELRLQLSRLNYSVRLVVSEKCICQLQPFFSRLWVN